MPNKSNLIRAMEEKTKVLIVPSLSGWEGRKLDEKLAGMGYETKLVEGAFGEIAGLELLSKSDYLTWKPDLVVAIGVGCIAIGTFVNAMRIMINPDFHYSEWIRDRKERGVYDDSQLSRVKRDCEDAEFDADLAKSLESKERSLRGEKPMLGIFTRESDDMADYKERYGDYELNHSLDLCKAESLDILAERIEQFLKEVARLKG